MKCEEHIFFLSVDLCNDTLLMQFLQINFYCHDNVEIITFISHIKTKLLFLSFKPEMYLFPKIVL